MGTLQSRWRGVQRLRAYVSGARMLRFTWLVRLIERVRQFLGLAPRPTGPHSQVERQPTTSPGPQFDEQSDAQGSQVAALAQPVSDEADATEQQTDTGNGRTLREVESPAASTTHTDWPLAPEDEGEEQVYEPEAASQHADASEKTRPARKDEDGRKRDPAKRGGRHHGPQGNQETQTEQVRRPAPPKLDIVCWKRERQWLLAVDLP